MTNSFVALDFETANNSRTSACSVGAVKVVDGNIVDSFYSLIKPHPEFAHFDSRNIMIHGIRPADVQNAPDFTHVWEKLSFWGGGLPLVAHNAGFDLSVLRHTLALYAIDPGAVDFFCTLVLARSVLNQPSNSLDYLAESLELGDFTHHDALEDAAMAAKLLLAVMGQFGASTPYELFQQHNLVVGSMTAGSWRGSTRKSENSARKSLSQISESLRESEGFEPSDVTEISGKNIVFTGTLSSMTRTEAAELVTRAGGFPQDAVRKDTDYLVVGQANLSLFKPGANVSSKYSRVVELRAKGSAVEFVDEQTFFSWLFSA